ncbi:MAG: SpoIID/LytB domain-containing protein [Limnochordia bacterium]|jgi:stage II sporulation protein D|nr:SpoIID/LytB domain-containing protein [Limnochordia bacterium]NLO95892.1 SpoIID/LytB domain-containing protein [Bacillota bacterium]HOQ73169.1 SpoIID/LytB domain-containing protein [Limnochordia bacterium]HPP72341.1 SpoIID/LytB domain-containing protein [Limnochordia bacterium]HPU64586.1 SpoIID/LytB domain-containing protein [Limnochordia bacterium]
MARKNQVVVLGLVLVAIASVVMLISWSGDDSNIVRELEEEPTLTVYVNETGEIKQMKLEEYLMGVVAGEMFPDWPVNAYAAQAIFARSFTMDFVSQGGVKDKYGADVSTSIEETQAYNPAAITAEIRRGVEMTRGQVMTYDNRYVRGWFHAYSGGITARAKEGLDYQEEEPPFTKSVRLPENEYAPEEVKAWEVEYSAGELRNLLAQRGVNVGEITGVEILERGPTERITRLMVKGSQGEQEMTGPEFRLAVDSTKMKSTLVREFSFQDGVLRISGTGYGHGVGLSQWDAFMLAKEGKSPEEIVQTFFEGVTIRKIYE